jgi:hypothetical protein
MLVKGMLRLCHLLVIRLSLQCTSLRTDPPSAAIRSGHRMRFWTDSLGIQSLVRWTCSFDADIPLRGLGVGGAVPEPSPTTFALLCPDYDRDNAAP